MCACPCACVCMHACVSEGMENIQIIKINERQQASLFKRGNTYINEGIIQWA